MGNILVCVAGLTPQIITESLYGFMVEPSRISIDEVRVITTGAGKESLIRNLLTPSKGMFFRFCSEYGFEPDSIHFDEKTIHVLRDGNGKMMEDIRSDGDNRACADQIMGYIRQWTAEDGTALFCSAAGGRKTMSLYLGFALQIYGRPQDTLSHVLVTAEFETHPEFYYVPRKNRQLAIRDRTGNPVKRFNTRDAKIEIAQVPYLRLREKFADIYGEAPPDYRTLVEDLQHEIDLATDKPDLVFNLRKRTIEIADLRIPLEPAQALLYLYFLENKTERCARPELPNCMGCSACFKNISDLRDTEEQNIILKHATLWYSKLSEVLERFQRRLGKDTDKMLSENRSKINRAIKKKLESERSTAYYAISGEGTYGTTAYGVRADKTKIRIIAGKEFGNS